MPYHIPWVENDNISYKNDVKEQLNVTTPAL